MYVLVSMSVFVFIWISQPLVYVPNDVFYARQMIEEVQIANRHVYSFVCGSFESTLLWKRFARKINF